MAADDPEKAFDLMRYADGEVSAEDGERIKKRLEGDRQAQERVAGVRELGEAVRTRLELEGDRLDSQGKFARMWSNIERAIETPAQAVKRAPASSPGLGARVSAWWESFHSHVLTGAAAVTAVLLFVIAVRPFERVVEHTVQIPGPTKLIPAVAESQPPEIENLEIYQGRGMILTVAGDKDQAPTAVIWLDSSDVAEGPL